MLNVFGRRLRYGISVAALMAGTQAALLLNAYGGEGMAMVFSGAETSIKIVDSTTPSNDWDSAWGDGYSVQDFFKSRSFTSYTGPVSTGKRLMQADGYIKPCRHNLLALSEFYPDPGVTIKWANPSDAVTRGQADPFGTTKASKFALGTGAVLHRIYQVAIVTTSTPVTCSYYAKANGYNYVYIREESSTGAGAVFDLSGSGSVVGTYDAGSVSISNATITAVSGYAGWFRVSCVMSFSSATTIGFGMGFPSQSWTSGDPANSWSGDTVSGAYFAFPMVNSGTQPLEYVSSEAHNICIRSQQFDNASWVKTTLAGVTANAVVAPDGTTTADRLLSSGSSTSQYVVMTHSSLTAGITYCASAYVKQDNYQYANMTIQSALNGWQILVDLTDGSIQSVKAIGGSTLVDYGVVSVGNGWFQIWASGTATTATMYQTIQIANAATAPVNLDTAAFTGTGTDGLYAWGAAFELASSPGKYVTTTSAAVYNQHFDIPVEYNTDGTVKALIREEARTNLCLQNTALATSPWAATLITPTNNSSTSPDGTTTATLLTTLSTSGDCYQSITITAAAYTWSAYVKRTASNPTTYVYLNAYDGSDHRSWFNLATGTAGTNDTGNTSTITDVGNGWYRITATRTAGGTGGYFVLGLSDADNSLTVTSGNQVYAWGAQLEAGSTASSPILTGSASVTRAGDTVSFQSTVYPHSATEDHFFYAKHGYDTGTHALVSRVIGLDSVSKTPIAKQSNLKDISYDGTNQLTPSNGASITDGTGVFRKSAYTSSGGSSGESAFTMDGQAAGTQGASGMSFSQRIELGSYSGTAQLNGGLIEFMYIPSRLTNGQLQTITTA